MLKTRSIHVIFKDLEFLKIIELCYILWNDISRMTMACLYFNKCFFIYIFIYSIYSLSPLLTSSRVVFDSQSKSLST